MLVSCLMVVAKGSKARVNNNGLKGQPWRVPHSIQKLLDLSPLVITEERGDL